VIETSTFRVDLPVTGAQIVVQIVRGKRILGTGLIAGWLLGGVVGFLIIQAR